MANTGPVRVTIFNQTYTLVNTQDGTDIRDLANTVDELMTSISRTGNLDATRSAVLACLHLADQLRAAQKELDTLRGSVESAARHFHMLLDRIDE